MELKKLLKDQKAQLSAEMIILIAAIIAIVLIVISQLQTTTTKANKSIDKTSDKIFDEIKDIK